MGIFRRLAKLIRTQTELEDCLLLHDARHCFGEYELDDGRGLELRSRMREVRQELSMLGKCWQTRCSHLVD
ncbi:hypothetical protein [Agrobacterium cavarae]|uniref:hypothetical protein n=1 Tax=Agrobacterium cavarae TaxID=2528239 RepID=UPI00289E54C1|nr:hypothetical protein [Agrobacterium cavarae]